MLFRSKDSSLTKSAGYYKEIFDKYPNSKDASRALFMSAFITANALRKYDEGKKYVGDSNEEECNPCKDKKTYWSNSPPETEIVGKITGEAFYEITKIWWLVLKGR